MPRNKTTRQLLAALSIGVVVALVVLLATCAATPTPSPVGQTAETTSSVDPPQESTRTVESSLTAAEAHNPTGRCVHRVSPAACVPRDRPVHVRRVPRVSRTGRTATHPTDANCSSCHSKPSGHPATSAQCSSCHKNAGVNWNFQHPASSDCADCHTAPKGHYGTDCNSCHSPSVPVRRHEVRPRRRHGLHRLSRSAAPLLPGELQHVPPKRWRQLEVLSPRRQGLRQLPHPACGPLRQQLHAVPLPQPTVAGGLHRPRRQHE